MSKRPILVVRPSGVWNSRSPLHNYTHHTREIDRDYAVLTVAVANVRYRLAHEPQSARTSARRRLVEGAGPVADKAWIRYQRSWRSLSARYEERPSVDDFDTDLATGIYAVRAHAVGRYSAQFETFVQCWALNMLLSALEADEVLSRAHVELLYDFSPFRRRFVIPAVPAILAAYPRIDAGLERLPHVYTDPKTGQEIVERPHDGLSAKEVVLFWRDFRNAVVHQGGMVSHLFCDTHFELFEQLRTPYADKLRPLEPGARFQLPDLVLSAMATTHRRCAVWMNEALQGVSPTRGRVTAREGDLDEPERFDGTIKARPLLVDGDHHDSLRWLHDRPWREGFLSEVTRRWRKPTVPKGA